jgi:aminoglycoside 2'-N-acetyltransferase I
VPIERTPGRDGAKVTDVRERSTDELSEEELGALRELVDAAWADEPDPYTDDDFANACGGVHFTVEVDGVPVAHASVVERVLEVDGRPIRTGYVEAVSTHPDHRRRGYATAIMRRVNEHVDRTFPLGALDTALVPFYERLGWVVWTGPTSVRTADGVVPTPEEDGGVMVRATPTSPPLDLSAPITCDWRPGDVW